MKLNSALNCVLIFAKVQENFKQNPLCVFTATKKRRQSSQTVMHTDTPILNCCKSLDCIQLKEFSDISTMYPAFNSVLYARAAHKGVGF